MDAQSLKLLNQLHPKLKDIAIKAWTEAQGAMPSNVKIVVTQSLRTFEESDKLYAQGRTTPGEIVTKAKAGQSYHNYGLAFDFKMITNGKDDWSVGPNWMKVVNIMKKYGFTWGGEFPEGFHDNPHFENHFGLNWRTLLELHNNKKLIPGTDYVVI